MAGLGDVTAPKPLFDTMATVSMETAFTDVTAAFIPDSGRELARLRDLDFCGAAAGNDKLFLTRICVPVPSESRCVEGREVSSCPFNTVDVPPVTTKFTSFLPAAS